MKPVLHVSEQISNCHVFLHYWKSVPPENVSPILADWVTRGDIRSPDCGTVACAGGWLSVMPEFQSLGVVAGEDGRPVLPGVSYLPDVERYLFGCAGIFAARTRDLPELSDHEYVTRRFLTQIGELHTEL